MSKCIYYSKEPKETAYCNKFKKYLDYGCGECKEVTFADVVEVVRCNKCIHNGSFDTDCPFGWRDERFNLPDDMDFCSYGEK